MDYKEIIKKKFEVDIDLNNHKSKLHRNMLIKYLHENNADIENIVNINPSAIYSALKSINTKIQLGQVDYETFKQTLNN